jgi:excisionase family DNA binding protein
MMTETNTKNHTQKAYLRPAEAAEYASVTRSTIYAWIKNRYFKSYSIKGVRLLKLEDLNKFIEGREQA